MLYEATSFTLEGRGVSKNTDLERIFLEFIIYHDLSWVKNGLTMILTMMNGIVYWMMGYFMGYSLVIEQMEYCHFLWPIQFDELRKMLVC